MTASTLTAHEIVQRRTIDTPIGTIVLEGTHDTLSAVRLPGSVLASQASSHALVSPSMSGSSSAMAAAARQLSEYFAGRRTRFDLPIAITGTPFQTDVWRSLGEIPYGETISYAQLAMIVGRPQAYRAVGQANGANPLPIILPCHRVLASGGAIGGYSGGLDIKRRLLALEGVVLDVEP